MGDRGNIVFRQEVGDAHLWMYSHWAGHALPGVLRDGLAHGRTRWTDEPYLARIIFDAVSGTPGELTGVGLSTYPTDNEHALLVVDVSQQRVELHAYPRDGWSKDSKPVESWGFEVYSRLTDEQVRVLGELPRSATARSED
jgi:hypothetical protein